MPVGHQYLHHEDAESTAARQRESRNIYYAHICMIKIQYPDS